MDGYIQNLLKGAIDLYVHYDPSFMLKKKGEKNGKRN